MILLLHGVLYARDWSTLSMIVLNIQAFIVETLPRSMPGQQFQRTVVVRSYTSCHSRDGKQGTTALCALQKASGVVHCCKPTQEGPVVEESVEPNFDQLSSSSRKMQ